jgi:hypothetical protein
MKHVAIALLILFAPPLHAANLLVPLDQIETLQLPYSLATLLSHLEKTLAEIDRPAYLQNRWKLTQTFFLFSSSKAELALLEKHLANLQTIHELNQKQNQKGDITDTAYLQSGNALLSKQIAVLNAKETCRNHLLTLLQLAHVEINHAKQHTQIPEDADQLGN